MKEATGQSIAERVEEELAFNDGLEYRVMIGGGDGKYSVLLYTVKEWMERMHQTKNPGTLIAEVRFEEWAIGQETESDIRQLVRMIYRWFVRVINGDVKA